LTEPTVPDPPALLAAFNVCVALKLNPEPPALRVIEFDPLPVMLVADMVPVPATVNGPVLLTVTLVAASLADVVISELLVKASVPEMLLAMEILPVGALVLIVPLFEKLEPVAPLKLRLPVVPAVLVMLPLLLKVNPVAAVTEILPVVAEEVIELVFVNTNAEPLATLIGALLPEEETVPALLNVPPFTLNVIE
jgi:hypothetical protein